MSTGILLVLIAALLLDRIIGDPDWLWRRLPPSGRSVRGDDRLV